MAVVSELAMRQTRALCLQQELREKEFELDLCHRRLEMGLAPSDEMEQEWLRHTQVQLKPQVDVQETVGWGGSSAQDKRDRPPAESYT